MQSRGEYDYQFNLTDHLGNVRSVFHKGSDGTAELLEERHYYPFGLEMPGMGYVKQGPENKYRFNGKEMQDENNLTMLDFGARMYDPQVGRWWNIDPHAENYLDWTPYNFVGNNPINLNDPTGMDWNGPTTQGYNWEGRPDDEPGFFGTSNSISEETLNGGEKPEVKVVGRRNPQITYLPPQALVYLADADREGGNWGQQRNIASCGIITIIGIVNNTVNLGAYGATLKGGSIGYIKYGNLWFKYYQSGWKGGSIARIQTLNLGACGFRLGIGTSLAGGLLSVVQFSNSKISPGAYAQLTVGLVSSLATVAPNPFLVGVGIGLSYLDSFGGMNWLYNYMDNKYTNHYPASFGEGSIGTFQLDENGKVNGFDWNK